MSDAAKKPPDTVRIEPALGLLEFSSIAAGIQSADAMVKRAVLDVVQVGTVHPGRFLVLVGGSVAEVEEAMKAGKATAPDVLNDTVFLPGVHPDVVQALAGQRQTSFSDSLGIIETSNVPAAIEAADKGVKGAQVTLVEIRLADGLHGKGLVLFTGLVSDVEAALELAGGILRSEQLVRKTVIPQLHSEIMQILQRDTRFGIHLGWAVDNGNT